MTAAANTLSSDSILTENSEFYLDCVCPASTQISVPEGTIHYTFPAHFLTVFIFSQR